MTGNELGLPFCGSGSPVHGCSTIGLAHSRNLLVSATAHYLFKNHYAQSVPNALPLSHCYSRIRAPAALRKAALTKKPHPAGNSVLPTYMLRGTVAKQELIYQPGAAPPSSSTGRQLNYWQRRILVWRPVKSFKNFLNGSRRSPSRPVFQGRSCRGQTHFRHRPTASADSCPEGKKVP